MIWDTKLRPIFLLYLLTHPFDLQHLRRKLAEAQVSISADDRLGGSPLMRLLYADPRPMLPQLPSLSDCPTHHSSFWSLSETLTVEHFSQRVDQEQGRNTVPLLKLFLKKVTGNETDQEWDSKEEITPFHYIDLHHVTLLSTLLPVYREWSMLWEIFHTCLSVYVFVFVHCRCCV